MIVCQCAGVSDGMIRQMVRDGAGTVAEIGRRSGAGLCCGPCRREIASLIAESMTPPPARRASMGSEAVS